MNCRIFMRALALGCALAAIPAQAQDLTQVPGLIDVDFTVSAVSDYRYRGVSLSDKDPALQAQLTVSHKSGAYVAAWASTIADNGGANIETQASIGYARTIDAFSVDLWASYYAYPGAAQDNYGEVSLRVGHRLGPIEVGALASYAPSQSNIGGVDNLYLGVDGNLALTGTPLTLTGSIGLEDGAFGDKKRDWSLGVRGALSGFDCALTYIDTARTMGDANAKGTVVLSIAKSF